MQTRMKNTRNTRANPVSSAFELRANNEIQCKSTMVAWYIFAPATVGMESTFPPYDRIFIGVTGNFSLEISPAFNPIISTLYINYLLNNILLFQKKKTYEIFEKLSSWIQFH